MKKRPIKILSAYIAYAILFVIDLFPNRYAKTLLKIFMRIKIR